MNWIIALIIGIVIGLLLAYKIIPLFIDKVESVYTHGFMGNVKYPSWFKKKISSMYSFYTPLPGDSKYPVKTFLTTNYEKHE